MFSYLDLTFQVNRSLERHLNTGQQRLYKICYLLPFDLWTSYLATILFLQGCSSLFWESPISTSIFNGLQYSFQVQQGIINVSEFFSYEDSLFILATKRKEDFRFNSTFRSDFLVSLGLFKGDKYDPIIFRILNSDLLLLLLFSFQFRVYLYYLG